MSSYSIPHGSTNHSSYSTFNKVPDTKDTIKFKLDSQEITYIVDMFHDTLKLLVETPDNPFIAPVNIKVIESFMQTVGYQGFVDKVSTFYTKFLAQPWQTMFKYPRFTKLIIADLMKKFPSIPQRLDEDYHSIKDDIPLVSVYSTGNVLFRGILIPDAFLTDEIHATYDFKEYEMVFVGGNVCFRGWSKVKKIKNHASKFAASMINDDGDDSGTRIEPESHKENPEVIDDDDVNDDDQKDKKKDDVGIHEMGGLENRTEKTQTPISTTPRSPRINLSSDKTIVQELTDTVSPSTTTTSKDPHKKRHISSKHNHLLGALRRMCRRQGYMIRDMERKCVTTKEFWKVHRKVDQVLHEIIPQLAERATNDLIKGNLKRVMADTITQERDAFQSEVPALILKEFDAHAPKINKDLFKNYVQNNKQQECDTWVEETIIDKDEVIPDVETPELITEF
ncbi:hypothetical protein Tco_1177387 [Tanacetum coccineum]